MLDVDAFARERGGCGDRTLELADVARPGMCVQRADGIGREYERPSGRDACDQCIHERPEVLAALAQRRQDERDAEEPAEEIAAEARSRDFVLEISQRRG